MDPISNPYMAAAGARPPALAGRESLRQTLRIAVERTRRLLTTKGAMVVGLRGSGKTVLLEQCRDEAESAGAQVLRVDAPAGRSLPALLAPELRLALLRMSRDAKCAQAAQRGLRALAGFAASLRKSYPDIEVGIDAEPELGLADSGDLEHATQALLQTASEAAQEGGSALVLFIDELHDMPSGELGALLRALHRCVQRRLPITLIGAGLPHLIGQIRAARPAAEQLFDCAEIGNLAPADAARAISEPAAELGVHFDEDALRHMVAATHGNPYFLQELAKQTWNTAEGSPITQQDSRNATPYAIAALDENFFRVGFNRLTSAEKKYLRAMADLGAGPHRSGDIAAVLARPVSALGPIRAQLIAKNMIWSPRHGDTCFAAPRFDEFLRRTWPGDSWRH